MLMWSLSTMSVHGQGWYAGTPTRMKETGNVHYSPLSVTLVRRIYAGGKKNIGYHWKTTSHRVQHGPSSTLFV